MAASTPRRGSGSATGRLTSISDGSVVTPVESPGGDIGRLAVCGTINDLAVGERGYPGFRPPSSSRKVARLTSFAASLAQEGAGRVTMRTAFGGARIGDMLTGEQLPRICWGAASRAQAGRFCLFAGSVARGDDAGAPMTR